MLSFFPRGVLDEILNLIESVSEDFPSYSFRTIVQCILHILFGVAAVNTTCVSFARCTKYMYVVI